MTKGIVKKINQKIYQKIKEQTLINQLKQNLERCVF